MLWAIPMFALGCLAFYAYAVLEGRRKPDRPEDETELPSPTAGD